MKASKTLIESLSDMDHVASSGDLRRIAANSLLALVRKEISATDIEAIAKAMDSITNSLNVEVKVIRTSIELRDKGADLGKVTALGSLLIGNARQPSLP
jgi:ribosomal 50S subunit-associated protein YjgA (DUF615 family)